METTRETRRAAYYEVQPNTPARRWYIYNTLKIHGGMTAEEITKTLVTDGVIQRFDMNYVRPRLTELKEAGLVETSGKKESPLTGRNTAVWEVKKP